jgi:hypothetical protein
LKSPIWAPEWTSDNALAQVHELLIWCLMAISKCNLQKEFEAYILIKDYSLQLTQNDNS